MDIICKQDIISWGPGGRHTQRLATMPSTSVSACSNSAVAPLILRAWESDIDRKGCLVSPLQITCVRPAFFPFSQVALMVAPSVELGSSMTRSFKRNM